MSVEDVEKFNIIFWPSLPEKPRRGLLVCINAIERVQRAEIAREVALGIW